MKNPGNCPVRATELASLTKEGRPSHTPQPAEPEPAQFLEVPENSSVVHEHLIAMFVRTVTEPPALVLGGAKNKLESMASLKFAPRWTRPSSLRKYIRTFFQKLGMMSNL